VRSSLLWSVW